MRSLPGHCNVEARLGLSNAVLMLLCPCTQNVADHGETVEPSCPSSDDGCGSTSVDVAGNRGEAGSAYCGHIWDTSGVPVDYTFKVAHAASITIGFCLMATVLSSAQPLLAGSVL